MAIEDREQVKPPPRYPYLVRLTNKVHHVVEVEATDPVDAWTRAEVQAESNPPVCPPGFEFGDGWFAEYGAGDVARLHDETTAEKVAGEVA